jgi:hypothetical protein
VAARFSVRPLARLSVAVLFSPVPALVLRQAQAHSSLTRRRNNRRTVISNKLLVVHFSLLAGPPTLLACLSGDLIFHRGLPPLDSSGDPRT